MVKSSRNGGCHFVPLAFRSILTIDRGSQVMEAYPDVEVTVMASVWSTPRMTADRRKRPGIPMKYHTNTNGVRAPPSFAPRPHYSHRTECANCSKMFAFNPHSRAGLTGFSPDTVDTASPSIPTSAVRRSESPIDSTRS